MLKAGACPSGEGDPGKSPIFPARLPAVSRARFVYPSSRPIKSHLVVGTNRNIFPNDVAPQLTRWDLRGDVRGKAPVNRTPQRWHLAMEGDKWWGGPGPGNLGIFGWFR